MVGLGMSKYNTEREISRDYSHDEAFFRKICLEDRETYEARVFCYEPYSDFNFNSLYSWNSSGIHAWREYGNGLAIRLADYITGDPVLSYVGSGDVGSDVEGLIELSERLGYGSELRFVPEITIEQIMNNGRFLIEPDDENFDYIFSVKDLSKMEGARYKSKRHAAKRYVNSCDIEFREIYDCRIVATKIIDFLSVWAEEKASMGKPKELAAEFVAVNRILQCSDSQERLRVTIASSSGILLGFSVDELLPKNFVVSHYFKTLPSAVGLAEYFNQYLASQFLALGFEYWNWEQDLGDPGLRLMKRGYRPTKMLKKYTIRKQ